MRPRLAAAAALLAAAAVFLSAAPASAHDYLVGSSPAAGSTVTAPISSVSLTFDAAILRLGRGSDGVTVTGPDGAGRHFETRCATVADDTIEAPVALGEAGRYTISWRVVSADGHPVSDSIAFTYRPPAGATASEGSAAGPDCGVTIARSAEAGDSGAAALVVGIAVAAALLIAAALVVTVIVLRRSSRERA